MAKEYDGPDAAKINAETTSEEGKSRARAARRERQEALLDEALKETFPASDPISFATIRDL